jgi:hypothetical protein
LSQFLEGGAGDQVSIARVHTDYTIGDAFQQSHRVVSGHNGVGRIVLHAEILPFRNGIQNSEKNLLLLETLGGIVNVHSSREAHRSPIPATAASHPTGVLSSGGHAYHPATDPGTAC